MWPWKGRAAPSPTRPGGDRDGRDEPPAGENPIPPEQRIGIPFPEAAVWKRAIVMAAGPLMNFVLGFVVLLGLTAFRAEPIASRIIYEVEEGSLAAADRLEAGDEIVAVNGRRCFVTNDILYELARTRDTQADFTVRRTASSSSCRTSSSTATPTRTAAPGWTSALTVYALAKTPPTS